MSWAMIATATLAGDAVFTVDPAASAVTFTLQATMHEVEGRFRVEPGEIRFDAASGSASGRIVIDASSGDTSNAKRDRKMHASVLRSSEHRRIVFEPTAVAGTLAPAGSSDLEVSGTLRLLDGAHAIEVPVGVTIEGEAVRVRTTFSVPYVDWGLTDPSVFVLRVAKTVEVVVDLTGRLAGPEENAPDP